MKKMTYQCRFLADVVLNAAGASEGLILTLDYVPGSKFLGIVARQYSAAKQQGLAMELFHNGTARFGDAHIVLNNKRSLKVPADWFFVKGETILNEIYLHHAMSGEILANIQKEKGQLKQARQGYFIKDENDFKIVDFSDAQYYAMKSACNSKNRRAESEKMFGYTAMRKDTCWQFSVLCTQTGDNNEIPSFIDTHLTGEHSIGLSKSAQYGRVVITKTGEEDIASPPEERKSGPILLYAESRLAFLDSYGMPQLQISPQLLGLSSGSVNWEKSQILTCRYAPWNTKRRAADSDRICIDKGSVIVVECNDVDVSVLKAGVGYHKAEGFGELLINPNFLKVSVEGATSATKFSAHDDTIFTPPISAGADGIKSSSDTKKVIAHLRQHHQFQQENQQILQVVNDFVRDNASRFTGTFASQWGMVRSIAERSSNNVDLWEKLFGEEGYLQHGVAAEKWRKKGRKEHLRKLLKGDTVHHDLKVKLTIKLAAEMARAASSASSGRESIL